MKPTVRELQLREMREAQFRRGGRRKAAAVTLPTLRAAVDRSVSTSVSTPVSTQGKTVSTRGVYTRLKRWREKNRDRYNEYMRTYRKRGRARERAS
jgi:hypothetical protein